MNWLKRLGFSPKNSDQHKPLKIDTESPDLKARLLNAVQVYKNKIVNDKSPQFTIETDDRRVAVYSRKEVTEIADLVLKVLSKSTPENLTIILRNILEEVEGTDPNLKICLEAALLRDKELANIINQQPTLSSLSIHISDENSQRVKRGGEHHYFNNLYSSKAMEMIDTIENPVILKSSKTKVHYHVPADESHETGSQKKARR